MALPSNWELQSWDVSEEIIPDPSNPLAMQKRLHAVAVRVRITDTSTTSDAIGDTTDTLEFYVGTVEVSAPSGVATDWYLVSKDVQPVKPMANIRVVQRWEAWGDWATFVPA